MGTKENNFQKPNVLLISVDHWPGRFLAGLGHPVILTPTLDQLLSNGVKRVKFKKLRTTKYI